MCLSRRGGEKKFLPVVRRERTVVRSVPRIVQGVASVSVVTIDLQFVVFGFRIDFEVGILRVPGRHMETVSFIGNVETAQTCIISKYRRQVKRPRY